MNMKIFVTRQIPDSGPQKLKAAGYDVVISERPDGLDHQELVERLQVEDPDAVLCLLTDRIDDEVLRAAPKAKIFANYAVGFDNIDLEAAKALGLTITNTPDVLSEAVAEHTVALMLALGRRMVESDRFLRAGQYTGWEPLLFLGTEFKGKTLGIIGGGRIGGRVAEIMRQGFGMNIAYFDRKPNEFFNNELSATFFPDLDTLLPQADVISLHLPLTPDTRHLFDESKLAKMKPTSLLINTARGPIVDEAALATALKEERIKGAALDVFEREPEVHPGLLSLSNVIMTPHIASATLEAREAMSTIAADNIIAVLNGQPPLNPV